MDLSTKEKIEYKLTSLINEANRRYNINLDNIKSDYSLKGQCAGKAIISKNKIRLNNEAIIKYPDIILNEVLPHELSHIIDHMLHGKSGHSRTWKKIMVDFGLMPNRCHNMALTKAKKTRKYNVYCLCANHKVGPVRYKNIVNGIRQYKCKNCKSIIHT